MFHLYFILLILKSDLCRLCLVRKSTLGSLSFDASSLGYLAAVKLTIHSAWFDDNTVLWPLISCFQRLFPSLVKE